MKENHLKLMSNLFQGKEIRSVWDSEKEDYYFSIVDVIDVLAEPKDPSDYWTTLKKRMINEEKSEIPTICRKLKLKSKKDNKYYQTDTLDTKGILRLIESIPSSKAEPFKLWLADLGKEEIDNTFNPSKGIDKMLDYYLAKGYSIEWIEARIKAIINRKKLTYEFSKQGISTNQEYAILTNQMYKVWSGMTASEYKEFKGIRKESLRDNMSDIEEALTSLSEAATKEIVKTNKPVGLNENIKAAKQGGHVAKVAREDIEKTLAKSVVTSENNLDYKYIDSRKIE